MLGQAGWRRKDMIRVKSSQVKLKSPGKFERPTTKLTAAGDFCCRSDSRSIAERYNNKESVSLEVGILVCLCAPSSHGCSLTGD